MDSGIVLIPDFCGYHLMLFEGSFSEKTFSERLVGPETFTNSVEVDFRYF